MKRYQDISFDIYKHIVELTKAGEFDGHQAARTVLIHCAMHTANRDDPANKLRAGYVMGGVIAQKAIMERTGLSKGAVSQAVNWLHNNGFIHVTWAYEGDRQRISSICITSYDAEAETGRQEWLAESTSPQDSGSLSEPANDDTDNASGSLTEPAGSLAEPGRSLNEPAGSLSGPLTKETLTKETSTKETLQREQQDSALRPGEDSGDGSQSEIASQPMESAQPADPRPESPQPVTRMNGQEFNQYLDLAATQLSAARGVTPDEVKKELEEAARDGRGGWLGKKRYLDKYVASQIELAQELKEAP